MNYSRGNTECSVLVPPRLQPVLLTVLFASLLPLLPHADPSQLPTHFFGHALVKTDESPLQ